MSTPRGDGGRGGRGDYAREPQLGSAPSHPRVNPRGGGRGGGRDGRGREQSGSGSSQPLGGGRGGGRGFRRPGEYQRELEAGVPHNQPRGGIGGGGRGRGYPGGGDGAVAVPPPPFHTSSAPPELHNQPPPSQERQRTVHLPSSSSSAAMGKELEQKLVGEPSGTAPTALLAPVSSKGMKPPARPGFGTVGRKCVVRANHFLVQVSDKDLHHYDVAITPEVISRSVNKSVIARLVELYGESHLGRRKPAYDGRKSLHTAGALPFTSKDFAIKLMETDERGETKKEREFKVTIKLAGRPDLHHLQEFLRGRYAEVPQETIQVLDVVLRESPSNNFITVARSFFSPSFGDRIDMGEGLECYRGYYQSLRPTQMGLSLNIDISATAFYKAVPVIDFVAEYLNIRDVSRPLSDTDRVKIKKALKGVRVESTHRTDSRRSYKITGISPRPLNELRFSDQDGKELSVVQYFRERYNYALHYVFWPCLQAGSDSRPAYLPMEVCKIVEGQRYSKKLNERQVTAILRSTCQRPSDRERRILEIVNHNNYHKDCYANEFGIKIMNQLVSIDARVLPAPRLKYHDSGRERMVSPEVGQWNMINKKMVNGGAVERWTCVNFSRLGQDAVHRFCSDLVQMCNNIGMVFNKNPLIAPRTARPERIEATLKEIYGQTSGRENYLQLLVVVLPDFSGSYGKIKRICETEIGIISQCCLPKNVFKCNKQYLENLALKINVKVGGRNTQLEEEISKNIPPFNGLPTIIFGADVTHPPPGEDSSPSIAAVVASMDWPEATKYKGLVSAQAHREEIIRDLFNDSREPGKGTFFGGMIRELLIAFYRSTNMKPQRIIFYRDGVSEGQFSEVLLHEMDAIRRACASLEDGYLPPVTFVVVQKRHHTRLFPEMHGRRDLTDRSGNILPGTVVDTRICHPREFDFYLCSHAGIQGTSRPTHYHVLFDENNFSADALQTLTNKLCYTYARCTRSVSIVPPAYYAHLAAFRARYYTEDEPSDGTSSSPARGAGGVTNRARSSEVRPLPKIKDNVKEVMFYC